MASIRSTSHRRRSRSASNFPSLPRRSPDSSLRIAAKRVYPTHGLAHGHTSTPHKWDVDAWRRGKRRRRGISVSTIPFSQPLEQHDTPHGVAHSGFVFSTSSADFNLFPNSTRSSRRRASYSSPRSESALPSAPDQIELTRLRSNAFWELHRSITENGEGFVQRMRDYERVRSCQTSEPIRRGRKRAFHPQTTRTVPCIADSDGSEDEDDDVQIFAGELSIQPSSRSFHHGKRAASMDVPCYNSRKSEAGYHVPLKPSHFSPSSSPSSDGDGLPLPVVSGSPLSPSVLSLSSTTPSSLSSPIQSQRLNMDNCPNFSLPPSISHSASTSPLNRMFLSSDKAVSDLTLALASGAGGLNDYSYLQNLSNLQPMDTGETGELWH
ncbi:hypothetical protein AN958_04898 [Leucoagaricus sp. SymC.cos]|nr:hypothetical protein AN958_04898 [Leucoagaricus sp. SymC.cos]